MSRSPFFLHSSCKINARTMIMVATIFRRPPEQSPFRWIGKRILCTKVHLFRRTMEGTTIRGRRVRDCGWHPRVTGRTRCVYDIKEDPPSMPPASIAQLHCHHQNYNKHKHGMLRGIYVLTSPCTNEGCLLVCNIIPNQTTPPPENLNTNTIPRGEIGCNQHGAADELCTDEMLKINDA